MSKRDHYTLERGMGLWSKKITLKTVHIVVLPGIVPSGA